MTALMFASLQAQKLALRAQTVCAADVSLREERLTKTRLTSLSRILPKRLRMKIDSDNNPGSCKAPRSSDKPTSSRAKRGDLVVSTRLPRTLRVLAMTLEMKRHASYRWIWGKMPVRFVALVLRRSTYDGVRLTPQRLCHNREIQREIVMPAKAGIQKYSKRLDDLSRFACAE